MRLILEPKHNLTEKMNLLQVWGQFSNKTIFNKLQLKVVNLWLQNM